MNLTIWPFRPLKTQRVPIRSYDEPSVVIPLRRTLPENVIPLELYLRRKRATVVRGPSPVGGAA